MSQKSSSLTRSMLASLLLCISAFLATGASAGDGKRFDEKTIRGTWVLNVGFTATDSVTLPGVVPGADGFAVALGTFDGRGKCQFIDQIVAAGAFIPSRDGFRDTRAGGDCTYSVNPDGTGFFDVSFAGAGVTHVTFVIRDRDEIHFIGINETLGIHFRGELERQGNATRLAD